MWIEASPVIILLGSSMFLRCHLPFSPDLPGTNGGWKSKFCWVNANILFLPLTLGTLLKLDDSVSLPYDLFKNVSSFSHMCIRGYFFPEIVLALCHMNIILKARNQLPMLSVLHPDGNTSSFNLVTYLSGDITPKSIMLEGVIPDKEVGNIFHISGSPLSLPGFGSDVFSLEQLLVDSSSPPEVTPLPHVPSNAGVGSSIDSYLSRKCKCTLTIHKFEDFQHEVSGASIPSSSEPADYHAHVAVEGCADCHPFKEELDDACRSMTRSKKIISISVVNLRAADSMKLDGEEFLMKACSMYVELVEQHRTANDRVVVLENQRALMEANYERRLWDNEVLRAQFSAKLS
ncbi:unnamed protein product [Lactuca virosa]|uniref:Uncharacterized protein n=1 Tax=Lactuca virosa TaxID=75947 RepID=A0AAU9PGR5_9ASTR|nr:unnamed protein product [Lactuca virosa]